MWYPRIRSDVDSYMSEIKKWSIDWTGRELTIEVGRYANQANAACTCRLGDTEVLATVVESGGTRDGVDYFPLMVDYEERLYAAGKIKGSRFIKREGRPTDEAVLTSRMIDRSIRPLFNTTSRLDVQVILTVFSVDEENSPDIPALIAASCALAISPLYWQGPVAGVRVGLINDEMVLNPSYTAKEKSQMDLVVVTTAENQVIMIEAGAAEVPEAKVIDAINLAQKHNQKITKLISEIQAEIGKPKLKRALEEPVLSAEEQSKVDQFLADKIPAVLFDKTKASKGERLDCIDQLKVELDEYLVELQIGKEKREKVVKTVKERVEQQVSQAIIKHGKRVDGRALDEVRPLAIEVGIFPRTHGSGHFSRGETQVVSIVTLGAPGDVQYLDTMELEEKKRYMHHYNFPPYSVGEVAPLRGPGRRDIGHGALAEKALMPVLPPQADFPYAIRVVSEVLSSNGSSSMASTCGSTLALMDAGVPITNHVVGIAMGLASDDSGNHKIVTDIQDLEDSTGGMDFKICGTNKGITAIQLDTKTLGLSDEIVKEAFTQARQALNKLIAEISQVIPAPRSELSPYAPRIYTLHIDPEKIGLVIGPGGKMINKIIEATEVEIDIEKDGTVLITAVSKEGAEKAISMIEELTKEVEVGEVYEGQVVKMFPFGVMVQLTPSQDGLVHVSNLSNDYVKDASEIVKVGDTLRVKVFEKDDQGRFNLTVEGVEPKRGNGSRGSSGPRRGQSAYNNRRRGNDRRSPGRYH